MAFRYSFSLVKRFFNNLYLLTFLNGFLLSSLLYFSMEATYEGELFAVIKKSIDKKTDFNDTQDSLVIKVMESCNNLLRNRASIFNEISDFTDVKVNYLHPASIDLMTARGACGSYSLILARVLQNFKFPVRIAQMKANGVFGAHNIIETKIQRGWVVLDPTFNLYFTRPDKTLANFNDVKNNWAFYRKQLPAGYDSSYKYTDVRYTNWGKIPILLPSIKKFLDIAIGKKRADTVCMRVFFLRMYDIYFYFTLFLFIPVFLITLKKVIKLKIFPRADVPFTGGNIIKYIKQRFENTSLKTTVNT
jgi:hypothetical protein